MAAPVIASESEWGSGGNATSFAITMPANVAAGDFLIAVLTWDGDAVRGTTGNDFYTYWVRGDSLYYVNSTAMSMSVYYKTADGTEGSTETFTLSASEQLSAAVYRITGVLGPTGGNGHYYPANTQYYGRPDYGTGTSILCEWSNVSGNLLGDASHVNDILCLAVGGSDDDDNTSPWAETNWTEQSLVKSTTGAGTCMTMVSTRSFTDAYDDPSDYSTTLALAASEEWLGAYIVVVGDSSTQTIYQISDGWMGLWSGLLVRCHFGYSSTQEAQAAYKFVARESASLTGGCTYILQTGTLPTDDVYVDLVGSDPDGSYLARATLTQPAGTMAFWTWAETAVTAGSTYHIRFSRTGSYSTSSYYAIPATNQGEGDGEQTAFEKWTDWSNWIGTAVFRLYKSSGTTPKSLLLPDRYQRSTLLRM